MPLSSKGWSVGFASLLLALVDGYPSPVDRWPSSQRLFPLVPSPTSQGSEACCISNQLPLRIQRHQPVAMEATRPTTRLKHHLCNIYHSYVPENVIGGLSNSGNWSTLVINLNTGSFFSHFNGSCYVRKAYYRRGIKLKSLGFGEPFTLTSSSGNGETHARLASELDVWHCVAQLKTAGTLEECYTSTSSLRISIRDSGN